MRGEGVGFAYRLGLDVGVASLGVAIVEVDADGRVVPQIEGAVRQFDLPLGAEDRRLKRSQRRNIERRKQRQERLMALLQDLDLVSGGGQLTKDVLDSSPIVARAAASRGVVDKAVMGRALLHLSKHRGSSAISMEVLAPHDEETEVPGVISQTEPDNIAHSGETERKVTLGALKTLMADMERLGFATYGQYLRWREKKNWSTRVVLDTSGKHGPAHCPSRDLIRAEFDYIWAVQAEHDPDTYTEDAKARVADELFFQRRITPPPIGDCPFFPGELRLAKASRLFQVRRILEAVNHLRFYDRRGAPLPFTLEQRDLIVDQLMQGENLTMAKVKAAIGYGKTDKVKGEDTGTTSARQIKGYPFDRLMRQDPQTAVLWDGLSDAEQDQVLALLVRVYDDDQAVDEVKALLQCSKDVAHRLVGVPLPAGYGRMGATATAKLIGVLRADIVPARVALDQAGLSHSEDYDGVVYPRLPYYGEILTSHTVKPIWVSGKHVSDPKPSTDAREAEFGRIPNPVVHASLNQIRKTVNAVIARYGVPQAIHIELSRDLNKSAEDRDAMSKQRDRNTDRNDEIRSIIEKHGFAPKRALLQKYKLWAEQGGLCLYSGEAISETELFHGDVDVDHILPRSKTFDDGLMNKAVCWRKCNAAKSNRPPYDAFHAHPDYDWEAIKRRVEKVNPRKLWRFRVDAMEKFEDEGDFRARFWTDNSYIARMAARYMSALYGEAGHVIAVSSHITGLLRGKWGLGSILGTKGGKKSRDDHRHHFIDALVVACTDRSAIQAIMTEAGRTERENLEKFVERIPTPFGDAQSFHAAVEEAVLQQVLISPKANHAADGQLHEETLLGIVGDGPNKKGFWLCRKRKALTSFDKMSDFEKLKIPDSILDADAPQSERDVVDAARQRLKAVQDSLISLMDPAEDALVAENLSLEDQGKKPKEITSRRRFAKAVQLYLAAQGGNTLTLFERQNLVAIRRAQGNQHPMGGYKGGNNHRIEFYTNAKGKLQWQLISRIEAVDPHFQPKSEGEQCELLFKVHKNDVLEIDDPDAPAGRIRVLVQKFSEGKLRVCSMTDARLASERKNWGDKGLSFYAAQRARRLVLDELGHVKWAFPMLPAPKPKAK